MKDLLKPGAVFSYRHPTYGLMSRRVLGVVNGRVCYRARWQSQEGERTRYCPEAVFRRWVELKSAEGAYNPRAAARRRAIAEHIVGLHKLGAQVWVKGMSLADAKAVLKGQR